MDCGYLTLDEVKLRLVDIMHTLNIEPIADPLPISQDAAQRAVGIMLEPLNIVIGQTIAWLEAYECLEPSVRHDVFLSLQHAWLKILETPTSGRPRFVFSRQPELQLRSLMLGDFVLLT